MKRVLLTLAAVVVVSTTVFAAPPPTLTDDPNPTFMVGLVFQFGDGAKAGDIGFTGKLLSTNRPNEFAVGAGVSYFPWSADKNGPLGLEISAGYNIDHANASFGFHVLRWKPSISLGHAWTEKEEPISLICSAVC